MLEVRCTGLITDKSGTLHPCNRLLGKVEGRIEIKCPKCGTINSITTEHQQSASQPKTG